jgi:hypothetical protein
VCTVRLQKIKLKILKISGICSTSINIYTNFINGIVSSDWERLHKVLLNR